MFEIWQNAKVLLALVTQLVCDLVAKSHYSLRGEVLSNPAVGRIVL